MSRYRRSNRFPSSQENDNGIENLFTRIFELLVKRQYSEAEQMLDLELSLDSLSGESILSWTELKLCQGEPLAVSERVSPLVRDNPTNAYYFLSHVLSVMYDWDLYNDIHDQLCYDDFLELVAERGAGCSDVLAKMALASIRRGMWKPGMFYFIEAIKAKERDHNGPADLLLLSSKNEHELESYLDCVPLLVDEPPAEVIELVVKTICILLIAYEDLGICEARPVAVMLAERCRLVAESWEDLSFLFGRLCPGWVEIQRTDGVPMVRARMDGLIPSHLIC